MPGATEKLKAGIRKLANALGYDIVGYDRKNPRTRLAQLLALHRITLTLDVGANNGAFGWDLRELGYRGRIVSFEPLPHAFQDLLHRTKTDPAWQAANIGLGDRDEERVLNVAANSQSSSLLPMLGAHTRAAPESLYKSEVPVIIRRLDGVLPEYRIPGDNIFLKIDTQGFEKNVLAGARSALEATPLVQLECSLVPLYENAELVEDMLGFMRALGYDPIDALPTFYHHDTGHLMQVDVLFLHRRHAAG